MTGQEAHEPEHWEFEEVPCDYCGETDAQVLLTGIKHLPLRRMDRWSTSLAGLSLVACGGAIQWLRL